MLSTSYLASNTLGRALVVLSQARPTFSLIVGFALLMPVRCLAADFAGCYELQLSEWSPAISLGRDEKYVTPPKRIALTTTIANSWGNQHGFKVIPTNGAAPSIHPMAYWTSDAHQVHIVWRTGFAGLTMDLAPQGSNLVGTAYMYFDSGDRRGETSHVVAKKIPCEAH